MLSSSAQVVVRKAGPADATALAAVFGDSWRFAYRGIIPHLHLESMIRRRGADWWANATRAGDGLLVLEVAGTIAGYATFGRSRERRAFPNVEGEIYEIYLAPAYQGGGFGERLFESCRYELDRRGLDGLLVWALADNSGAIEFYWRRGGRPEAKAFDRIGGAMLAKIAFVWN